MNLEYSTYGFNPRFLIENFLQAAFDKLKEKARYGLGHPISKAERAKRGCIIHCQRVDYWITMEDKRIPIRVEMLPSRPPREYIRKLIGPDGIPTLLVYAKIGLHALVRKVAKCIKLGLDKLRYAANKRIWSTRNPQIVNQPIVPEGPKWNPYKSEDRYLDRVEYFA